MLHLEQNFLIEFTDVRNVDEHKNINFNKIKKVDAMSKMFVVIDEPNDCFDCPLLNRGVGLNNQCSLSKRWMGSIDLTKRPNWCPLKALPEKYEVCEEFTYENMWGADEKWAFTHGWNSCLNEILKEE